MHVTHSVMACLPGLRSSFVTVDESEKDRDKTALGEGTWEEVRAVQQTNTTVNKWSELYKKKINNMVGVHASSQSWNVP